MKNLDREFKLRERILLLILGLIVIGVIYFYLVHRPVTKGITAAQQQISELTAERDALDAQIALLEKMEDTNQDPVAVALGYMPSYSYSEEELRLLNDVLQNTQYYTVTFSGLSRDGNQIRRSFSLSYQVSDYDEAQKILYELTKTELRCLIGDMSCSVTKDGPVNVNVSAVFYETLVEGTPDAVLPAG